MRISRKFTIGLVVVIFCMTTGCQAITQTAAEPVTGLDQPSEPAALVPATEVGTPVPAAPTGETGISSTPAPTSTVTGGFDGERALADVFYQDGLGPRVPYTPAHAEFVTWAQEQLADAGWTTNKQHFVASGLEGDNITARRLKDAGKPVILVGAHYDSRSRADRDPDPDKRAEPVPGANDGASGVAVLLELARVLPEDLNVDVWLVLFDLEDQGSIGDWDWSMGAQAYVEALKFTPLAMVLVDMVGDPDLNIYREMNSTKQLKDEIWDVAASLGHTEFINQEKHAITDDHIPFLNFGIPAVDIIDIDYTYWHTTQDTADKVSADSLQIVGEVVMAWLMSK